MIIFVIAMTLLPLIGIKLRVKNGFEDYMSPQKTGAVKGIFVIMVFFSHIRQYCPRDIIGKGPYVDFMNWFGQLMVVMFLFYSGYGVYLAIEKKEGYIKSIPKNRILKVWYHFAIAILLYLVYGLCVGKSFTLQRFFESLIGKSDIGNSSWFIFTIILLYAATFFGFIIVGREKMLVGTIKTTVLSIAIVAFLYIEKGKNYWWYDTALCYPLGMWYAMAKPKIDKALMNNFGRWLIAVLITVGAFLGIKYGLSNEYESKIIFFVEALIFGLAVALLTMRISVNNAILRWFGKHIMGIYILQRIPMMFFKTLGFDKNPIVFSACSFAATLLIAWIYDFAMEKLDVLLRLSPKKK